MNTFNYVYEFPVGFVTGDSEAGVIASHIDRYGLARPNKTLAYLDEAFSALPKGRKLKVTLQIQAEEVAD